MKMEILEIVKKCKTASYNIANLSTEMKNNAIELISESILKYIDRIIQQNNIDIDNAKRANLSSSLIDRLILTEKRIIEISDGIKEIIKLPDPVGNIISEWTTKEGLRIQKVSVSLGVICIIYESRPNVTVDSACLCLKSSNVCILRGGKEAINSNRVLAQIIIESLYNCGIPSECVTFIDSTERQIIYQLIKLDRYIDLIIPRGNEQMINEIREKATVPVLSHGKGLCHTYIDNDANLQMAKEISYNAKVQRPGVCNAMETLLVHKNIAKQLLTTLAKMYKEANVELRGCSETLKIISDIKLANEQDFSTEYLDLILSIKIVNSLDEAIEHINKYGSGHSESIVSENKENAQEFLKRVDASAVFYNASTRLHDGGVFGLGAEIGISTQKLHARGTMGIKELTTTKYIVYGSGHIRK